MYVVLHARARRCNSVRYLRASHFSSTQLAGATFPFTLACKVRMAVPQYKLQRTSYVSVN